MFNNIISVLFGVFDDDEEYHNMKNNIGNILIAKSPSCEHIIHRLFIDEEFDENDEYDYSIWWKPRNEIMNGDYEKLFNTLNDFQPNAYKFTKDVNKERNTINYIYKYFNLTQRRE